MTGKKVDPGKGPVEKTVDSGKKIKDGSINLLGSLEKNTVGLVAGRDTIEDQNRNTEEEVKTSQPERVSMIPDGG